MATFETTARFDKDHAMLDPYDKERFKRVVLDEFVPDLAVIADSGGRFRNSLRVKGVRGAGSVLEMTWAPDGRATFMFGEELKIGEPHVIWRRVGTHDIFRSP